MLPRIHPKPSTSPTIVHPHASLTTLSQDRNRALLRAVGEWDLANADLLARQLKEHETAGRRFVRLDVGGVSFLDCTCLGVLATAHHQFLAAHGTLVLTGVTPRIMRLLSLTRLDQVLLTTSTSDLHTRPQHAEIRPRRQAVRPIKPA